jgi:hypothetical protein
MEELDGAVVGVELGEAHPDLATVGTSGED